MKIPFNKPYIIGKELFYIAQAVQNGHLAGDGYFSKLCHTFLQDYLHANKILLTHSCSSALEMAAILCDFSPGDEVILPSYTFVSTANAFILRSGCVPKFVDIRQDTLNLDENLIERAITPRTKAIVPVHYAGVSCEMGKIMQIAKKYELRVIEDAAQGINAKYKNQYLGTIGDLGCYSFHETKNLISGEGGALAVNDANLYSRAEIIREKGTNRSQFFRGMTDKYTWVDVGSSFLPSELTAAFLYAQLEEIEKITKKRMAIWNLYRERLFPLEQKGILRTPFIPEYSTHNAHMFYLILDSLETRTKLISYLKEKEIMAVFHYVPLHSSPAGQRFSGNPNAELPVTDMISSCLVRLPFYYSQTEDEVHTVCDCINNFFGA